VKRLVVGVLYGGRSAEHEVSILSARNILVALDRARFKPVLIGIDKNGRWLLQEEATLLESASDPRLVGLVEAAPSAAIAPYPRLTPTSPEPTRPDVIFPVLHGPLGEDGTIQGLLDLADIPYVGAGVLGSALGMDKDAMKRLLREAGIPVAAFRAIRRADFEKDPASACRLASEVGFPLFTKPANLGSSVGVRRVASEEELRPALSHAFEFDIKALAEAAVPGREIECSVLGNDEPLASVPGEVRVRHKDGFYSYEAKYVDEDGATLQIPAELSESQTAAVQELARKAFKVLECSGMARVDFFLRSDGGLVVNEINTIPGFTAISMYPKLWEASGLKPRELVSRLIDLAIERHERRKGLKTGYDFTPHKGPKGPGAGGARG